MGILSSFQFITLNGFYKGPDNDISWHQHGGEESAFAEEGAQSGSTLLFGRITYEMMAGFWPTAEAQQAMPVVAEGMNKSEKIVFSRTLKTADWNNTRIVKDNIEAEVKRLKEAGKAMTILGSGSILTQLANSGLIDEYQVMIDPVALGSGTPLFEGLQHHLDLQLINSRVFKSGVVLLSYLPIKK
ncbi:dihydrofolate reductase [Pseudoflavitalea sp. X16]|uniref:dihydrofolate reductase family protein n=1 Tax=Paraflavitalea devenefica TaxID=2716334 RepID=UPI00141F8E94|nr:dihydrofolate reductase family protein [Paraflavitalea devenefica]NII27063.1 dihydrofolate reductase [Paraflavitalea devenefica]